MKHLGRRWRRITSRPRRVLVLSGGGSRGAAQLGMVQALFEAGISFDAVVGCSVGSLTAVRLAHQPDTDSVGELVELWSSLRTRDIFPMTAYGVARGLLGRQHLIDPTKLRELITRECPVADLSNTKLPLGVVTTRLDTGTPVLWQAGSSVDILTASCALPGLLPPVTLADGVSHIDGGGSSAAPINLAADAFTADEVWLLDVLGTPGGRAYSSARDIYLASFSHAVRAQANHELRGFRQSRLRHVKLPAQWASIDSTDFGQTAELYQAGYTTAQSFLSGAAL